jgi:hypothetical protein
VRRSPLKRTQGLTRSGFVRQQTALKRASTLARTAPLAPVGRKKAAEQEAWETLAAERSAVDTDRETGLVVCQAVGVLPGACWGPMACHHLYRTGQGFPKLCPVDRLRSVCEGHHTGWPNGIHVDTARARRLGLILG